MSGVSGEAGKRGEVGEGDVRKRKSKRRLG